jgi:uncharacterized membrane protein YdjX (TVP38/TMEM64 family)
LSEILAWMDWVVQSYGYLGAFAVCLLGNLSIILPVPFALVVYAFGATLDPLILGLVSGVGCTVGELSAYLVGRGGRRIMNRRYGKRFDAVERLIDRYGALVVFLAALLPIPDDLILIPLGILKYDLKKILVAMFVGKTLMCLVIAYAGKYSYSFVVDIFESSGWMGVAASVVLLAITLYIMVRVDWTKLFDGVAKAASQTSTEKK